MLYFGTESSVYRSVSKARKLRFFGISGNSKGKEETQQVLKAFMQSELGMENASSKLNSRARVNRIGVYHEQATKPHQVIARFLRNQDRERVMGSARNLKG